jgi:hypothetical protein
MIRPDSPAVDALLPRAPPTFLWHALSWIVGGSRTRWLAIGVVLCTILPWFFSCPLFPANRESQEYWAHYWAGVEQRKIDHPLYDYTREFPPQSNEAKRNFRILIPLLARLTGMGIKGTDVVRYGLQAVLILGLLLAAERACGDRVVALGVALAIAGTHVGTEVWRDAFYWFDNCAHAFAVLALLATGPWLAGGAVLLGLLVDERVLGTVPLLALFHLIIHSRRSVLVGLALGASAYFAMRVGLSVRFGLHYPLTGIGATSKLIPNLVNAPAAFWFALEGGWLLMVAAAREAAASGKREIAGLFAFTFLLLMASGFVGDFTRSASYAFPATLVALAALARSERFAREPAGLRALAGFAAGVSLIVPNAIVLGDTVAFESSLPVRAIQAWLRSI